VNGSYVFRPVQLDDLAGLADLVGNVAGGHTSRSNDPRFLEGKVHASERAFYPQIEKPGNEHYLFVLEDLETGKLIGTAGIIAQIGGADPFYTFEIRRDRQFHAPLQISREVETLHLKRNQQGPAELCSLFLHPDFRRGGLGKLLSLSRFLFMRNFPERFAAGILAELRGYRDPAGDSPFWEAVGKYFFKRDTVSADVLGGLGEKGFIEALLPHHPIYPGLLPKPARDVIGRVHRDSEAARQILLAEGFGPTDEVDLFDAGPILRAELKNLRTVQRMRSAPLESSLPADANRRAKLLVATRSLAFRSVLTFGELSESGTLTVEPSVAPRLGVEDGAVVDYCFLAD